jgi:DNA-binding NarL/FixJ family response regulator
MVASTAFTTRLGWSVSTGIPWSICPGIGGQLAPESGGLVHQNLQADLLHIPIIYFTAHHDIQALSEEAGADAYLAKPFDLEKLYTLIQLLSFERIADY